MEARTMTTTMTTPVKIITIAAVLMASASFSACTRTQKTIAGAGVGGVAGGLLGNEVGGTGGAIVGGLGGAAAGGYVGRNL